MTQNLPSRVEAYLKAAYDPASGLYRRQDGTLDDWGPTEIETLETWHGLLRCLKPKVVVETGVLYGLSTCYIAAALRDNGVDGAKVYLIDPWNMPHLWDGSDLERFIEFFPLTSQDAAPRLAHLKIDVLVIDSLHTYAQASWELMTFEPQLREGGFIIMHDSLILDGVGRTAQHLYDSPRFEAMTFDTPRTAQMLTVEGPVSMGCTIARKIRNGMPFVQDPSWLSVPENALAGPLPFIRQRTLEGSGAWSEERSLLSNLRQQLLTRLSGHEIKLIDNPWEKYAGFWIDYSEQSPYQFALVFANTQFNALCGGVFRKVVKSQVHGNEYEALVSSFGDGSQLDWWLWWRMASPSDSILPIARDWQVSPEPWVEIANGRLAPKIVEAFTRTHAVLIACGVG